MDENVIFILGDKLPTIYEVAIQINDVSSKPIHQEEYEYCPS